MRCDSHIHVVGPTERYPQLPNRTYTAGLATLEQLERAAAPRNVRRFVIVQPSFYGADNSLLMDGLSALQERGRGVAVIEPGTLPIRELMKMKSAACAGCGLIYTARSEPARRCRRALPRCNQPPTTWTGTSR
jgi:predicted TIM-barrel fold metal-dependent hydrolase